LKAGQPVSKLIESDPDREVAVAGAVWINAPVSEYIRAVKSHFGRNGFFYSLDRTNGKFIKAAQYVNDLNWTKGLDPETGKPVEYNPKLDVQIYNPIARSLRGGLKCWSPYWLVAVRIEVLKCFVRVGCPDWGPLGGGTLSFIYTV
jgi:hypothetical protein